MDYSEEITKELKHTGRRMSFIVTTRNGLWLCFVSIGAGIVAMAGKTGSQFYITLAPTPWLGR